MTLALDKEAALAAWFGTHRSALIGFSGGVDSTYLAVLATRTLGADSVLAVIGRSASYPEAQWARAREVAAQWQIPVLEVETRELDDPRYAANPSNRCYFCKTELWNRLVPIAAARGLAVVVDGTNADDLGGHRPGHAAAVERGVHSPLAKLGFTQEEIRERSQALGIVTWDQPSSPCLASRLPTGTEVTPLRLRRVEAAEAALRALGVTGNLRVRHFGETARVEMDVAELERVTLAGARDALGTAVREAGYAEVEFDPRGYRSGALHAS
ncbi:MAG: ATP-dependent sacrificial sulfur transferase LarE [Gemmatimonadaceae bacterium]|nr:ATP-dependent sacrificial sulfur transferase LarE [Gemmatimonadaceae bacterium]